MHGRTVFMDSLVANGVEKIFGNPGTTENPILDSLIDYPQIDYLVHLHEGVAIGAAAYYAQASGKTGVVNLHVAPGLGNALGMIYGALKANAPLVVTAGQQDTRMRLHEPVLFHDLVAMAAPLTKFAAQVERADEMATLVRRAFQIAHEPPSGPVFLALPIDVMEQETARGAVAPGQLYSLGIAQPDGVAALVARLNASTHPVIVVGDEVGRLRTHAALVNLAETLGASVWQETLATHTLMPTGHPLYRGRLPVAREGIRAGLAGADVVLLVGGAFFDEVWFDQADAIPTDCSVLQIDNAHARLARKLPVEVGVVGDLGHTLQEVAAQLTIDPKLSARRTAELTTVRDETREKYAERLAAGAGSSPMSPAVALHALAQSLPDDVVIVDEAITAMPDVWANFNIAEPGEYFGARGGGIGQGIAGAIGVAVANRNRRVVAITGDGSAMYSIQALWTAAHHQLDILFVVLSNREYRVLKHNLDGYRSRFGITSNKPYPHMDLTKPTLGFAEIAQGLGVDACQVTDVEGLRAAMSEAIAEPGPRLIDIVMSGLESGLGETSL